MVQVSDIFQEPGVSVQVQGFVKLVLFVLLVEWVVLNQTN